LHLLIIDLLWSYPTGKTISRVTEDHFLYHKLEGVVVTADLIEAKTRNGNFLPVVKHSYRKRVVLRRYVKLKSEL
jgi:hypothetical protein